MSSIVEALYEIKFNPFKYGLYLASFYNSVVESENNILLAPLVISLCSHPALSKKISNSNIKSTIWSIFDDQSMFYDMQDRIDGFQQLTEQCIQYCLINDWLSLNENYLSLKAGDNSNFEFTTQKSPVKLGKLFSDHSVIEIYKTFGASPR